MLLDDLRVLVSSGMVNSIDKDGVTFNGDRLYETLANSFDLIMQGKPDTNFLEAFNIKTGKIVSNAFAGSASGGGLFDRMKMWSSIPSKVKVQCSKVSSKCKASLIVLWTLF